MSIKLHSATAEACISRCSIFKEDKPNLFVKILYLIYKFSEVNQYFTMIVMTWILDTLIYFTASD
jgi:hypothetical protein